MPRLSLRIDFAPQTRLGPGKIQLLERVKATGSIAAAGRSMGMSYRRAWLLVDALNHMFREPVVTTKLGGKTGGGAEITRFGEELLRRYREMETVAHDALAPNLAALEAALSGPSPAHPQEGGGNST
jgi:molybdate transport system regulatory protein